MIIKNGYVYQEDQTFQTQDLFVQNGTIVSESECTDLSSIDASNLYVVPGAIDVHTHGAAGYDFSDADAAGLSEIAFYLKSQGITTFCPTSMTLPPEKLRSIFQTLSNVKKSPAHACIAGIHMEGPFLSSQKKGAQNEDYLLPPNAALFDELYSSSQSQISLITIAPEIPGAFDFIQTVHQKYPEVHISLGHSATDYMTAMKAMDLGALHVTHLFNAMPPFGHRDPGLIGAALDHPECMVEAICDGIHICPTVIRSIFSLFGSDRVILISDSMRATGLPDGTYEFGGGETVTKKGRRATLPDGTIAASVTNVMDCMRTAVSFGIPLEQAIAAVTANPAKSIGIYNQTGSLTPGKRADILLLDQALNLVRII